MVHYIHILHWDLIIIFCVQISLKNSLNFYTGVQYKSSQFTIFGAGELKIFGELIGNKIIKNHQYWRLQIQRNTTVSIFFCFREKKDFLDGPAAVTVAEIFALELTLLLCMYSQKGRRKFLQLLEDTNDQSLETHNLALA